MYSDITRLHILIAFTLSYVIKMLMSVVKQGPIPSREQSRGSSNSGPSER